jgi:hypothetical protein
LLAAAHVSQDDIAAIEFHALVPLEWIVAVPRPDPEEPPVRHVVPSNGWLPSYARLTMRTWHWYFATGRYHITIWRIQLPEHQSVLGIKDNSNPSTT